MAVATPLILSGYERGRVAYDQNMFHLVAIRQFARQWPNFDFSDYASATTPGYHLTLAAVARFISPDLRIVKFAGAIFSIGLLATLATAVQRRGGFFAAILLCLPFLCSIYVFSSVVWLLPDNAGWWGVLAILLIALRPRVDSLTYLVGGALLVALVLVRQSHLWVAAPLAMAAWLGPRDHSLSEPDSLKAKALRLLPIAISAIAAVGVFASFVLLWHGLIPPSQIIFAGGINLAGPAMALAVTAMLGIFYVPFLLPRLDRDFLPIARRGAIAGLIVGIVPRSSYDFDAGRMSGIWNVVRHAPVAFHRSPLLVGMSTAGGAMIACWLAALPRRERAIWATAVIAFGVAQIFVRSAFQRYDEPLILMAAAVSLASFSRQAHRGAWAGPMILSIVLAAIAVVSLR